MRWTVVACTCFLLACSPSEPRNGEQENRASAASGQAQHLPKIALVVHHGEGAADTHLNVEIALTAAEQERGLQHRTGLRQGEGMLFPMVPPRMPSFWMKDTPLPLDLIFVRTDGSVGKVIANARPNDETPLFSEDPVSAILELNGGSAAALGIGDGDRINWGACTQGGSAVPASDAQNFCPG